jgi:hypothetical protein
MFQDMVCAEKSWPEGISDGASASGFEFVGFKLSEVRGFLNLRGHRLQPRAPVIEVFLTPKSN